MRRVALIVLACLGLTFALAGPASAGTAGTLSPLEISSVQSAVSLA